MTPLEERYRRLVGWLPEPARSRWSEDMVATYLEVATADDPEFAEYGSPSTADRWDVARLAVRLRLGAPGASPRGVATGRALRLVALAGTTVLATQALIGLVGTAWLYGRLPLVPAPALDGNEPVTWDVRSAVIVALELVVLALLVALVRGARAASALAGVALAGQLVLSGTALRPGPWTDWLAGLPALVPLLAAAAAPAEPVRPRPWWLLALPLTTVGVSVAAFAPGRVVGWLAALAQPPVQGAFVVALAALVLAVRRRPRGPAELAAAALAVAVLPGLVPLLAVDSVPGFAGTVAVAVATAAATAVGCGVAGVRALTGVLDHA